MKRSKKIYLLTLFILLCVSFFVACWDVLFNNKIYTPQISVITSGPSDESWMIIKEGAEQAATEMNANIRFIFLSEWNNLEEQIELLERESQNNVDAILVSPIEASEMIEVVEEVSKKVPIILIQSTMDTKGSIKKVVNNEYELGELLAEEVLERVGEEERVIIFSNNQNTTVFAERFNGFISIMDEHKKTYLVEEFEKYEQGDADIKRILQDETVGAIVCLDRKTSEYVAEYKKDIVSSIKREENDDEAMVFAVGNTNKIISYLDEGIINATAIQNEFNIGYIAVENAISIIDGKNIKEQKLKSVVINSENMYDKENERVLFQFIR